MVHKKFFFFRFNVGSLPAWAKTKLSTDNSSANSDQNSAGKAAKGRWASRTGGGGGEGALAGGEDSNGSVKDGSSLEWAR